MCIKFEDRGFRKEKKCYISLLIIRFLGHDAKDISWQSLFNTQRHKITNLHSQLPKPKHHLLQLTSSCNYEASGIPEMSCQNDLAGPGWCSTQQNTDITCSKRFFPMEVMQELARSKRYRQAVLHIATYIVHLLCLQQTF